MPRPPARGAEPGAENDATSSDSDVDSPSVVAKPTLHPVSLESEWRATLTLRGSHSAQTLDSVEEEEETSGRDSYKARDSNKSETDGKGLHCNLLEVPATFSDVGSQPSSSFNKAVLQPWLDIDTQGLLPPTSSGKGSDSVRSGVPGGIQSSMYDQGTLLAKLEQQFSAERAALLEQVNRQLVQHHKRLLLRIEGHISPLGGFPIKRGLSDGGARLPSVSRPVAVWTKANSFASNCPTPMDQEGKQYKSKLLASLSAETVITPKSTSILDRIVTSPHFEAVSCAAILLNVCLMALEVQQTGCKVSRLIHHNDCLESPGRDFLRPEVERSFTVLAVLFATVFTAEFCLRVGYLKREALQSGWMWFDLTVLAFGMVDTAGRMGSSLALGVNPTAMRAARIFRMLRMIRMLKMLRTNESFHTLFLLLKSILASRHALCWSILILFFTMTCAGLLINQLLLTYLSDGEVDQEDRRLVYEYFGTYTRMLITMFEITLGNWAPPSRILMEKVSQWWGIFIVLYRCVFCFALVNVTGAVFITESSRVAADDEVQMMRRARSDKKIEKTLAEVFLEIDTSGDGFISLDELEAAVQDTVVKRLLQVLDLQVRDIEELFALMDNGTGQVEQEEFIQSILQLRGPAQSLNVMAMMNKIKKMGSKLEGVCRNLDKLSESVEQRREVLAPF